MKLGPTGNFPRGKFNADDEGALAIAVSHTDKTVIVNFGAKVAWIGMDADMAIDFANTIKKHAEECKHG